MTGQNIVVVAALLGMVAGCGASAGPARSMTPQPSGPTNASCESLPKSSGPAATLAELRITASGSARSGETVPVLGSVHVTAASTRVITRPSTSRLLIVRDGRVVGETRNSQPHPDVPLLMTAGAVRPAQALPAAVVMSACAARAGRSALLPPGQYSLVAVLGYGQDRLNPGAGDAGGSFQLVSAPRPIAVT
jgi:hypothetical protein